MSKLALGTVQFGLNYGIANTVGQVTVAEVQNILNIAEEAGIDTLDTAVSYGNSEQVLGEVGVKNFKVITKIPSAPKDLEEVDQWVEDQLQMSLVHLGIPQLYGVLLHRSEELKGRNGEAIVRSLESLQSRGLVQKIGVSIYDPSELEYVTSLMELDLLQAPMNLLDRRLQASGWLAKLHAQGVEVHTRSAFLQGLLLLSQDMIPSKFEPWANLWDAWHCSLTDHQVTAMETCLGYLTSISEIDRVVIGVDHCKQLVEVIQAFSKETLTDDWEFMASEDLRLINPSNWDSL